MLKINIIAIVIFVVSWKLLVYMLKIPEYLVPAPEKVGEVFIEDYKILLSNAYITLIEAIIGFLIANLLSLFVAITISFYSKIEDVVISLAVVLKTIPVIAITPILILWLGSDIFSKFATSALICFFPSMVNVLRGVKSIDNGLLDLFKVYSANRRQLIKMLIIPSILPYLFSALKVSSSLAVVGALVGEFIGSNKGLGFIIISNYYSLNTVNVFAAIILTSLIGIIFYYAIDLLEKRLIPWNISIIY